jgi:hypothetical protein
VRFQSIRTLAFIQSKMFIAIITSYSWREKRLEMAFPMLPMLKMRTL